jgi:hypothetical protein
MCELLNAWRTRPYFKLKTSTPGVEELKKIKVKDSL